MTGRLIAIGDVHGCSKALATLLEAIQPTPQDTRVLGDYIDRGPDSRGVAEQVVALAGRCTVVPLLANHEEMALAAPPGGPSDPGGRAVIADHAPSRRQAGEQGPARPCEGQAVEQTPDLK